MNFIIIKDKRINLDNLLAYEADDLELNNAYRILFTLISGSQFVISFDKYKEDRDFALSLLDEMSMPNEYEAD